MKTTLLSFSDFLEVRKTKGTILGKIENRLFIQESRSRLEEFQLFTKEELDNAEKSEDKYVKTIHELGYELVYHIRTPKPSTSPGDNLGS
jgi:predicted ATPase